LKILIAEDDATSRLVLQSILQKAGHDVAVAEDGERAWDAWRDQRHPVLISDWQMPGLDGLQLCRAIREQGGAIGTYVILLTGQGGKATYQEAMGAGADDVLTKPAAEDVLTARLHVAERILDLQQHVKRLEGIVSSCPACLPKVSERRPR
jgi:DNA-binding response OmpR family regulator